jgi:tryptophan 2-monooxygenase
MFEAMLNRAHRQNPATPSDPNTKWWLSQVLSKSAATDRVSWDWSTYVTAGGFKLDMTGDYHQSNLCFRYHTHARFSNPNLPPDERLYNRVFLASDSYCHLGGWLEGAFMSAINAVAGIVVSINSGDFGALNDEARKLFTTFEPILPML